MVKHMKYTIGITDYKDVNDYLMRKKRTALE